MKHGKGGHSDLIYLLEQTINISSNYSPNIDRFISEICKNGEMMIMENVLGFFPCNNMVPYFHICAIKYPAIFLRLTFYVHNADFSNIHGFTCTQILETFHDCQQTPENENFVFAIFLQEPLRTT